jgi:hypothetical protein
MARWLRIMDSGRLLPMPLAWRLAGQSMHTQNEEIIPYPTSRCGAREKSTSPSSTNDSLVLDDPSQIWKRLMIHLPSKPPHQLLPRFLGLYLPENGNTRLWVLIHTCNKPNPGDYRLPRKYLIPPILRKRNQHLGPRVFCGGMAN